MRFKLISILLLFTVINDCLSNDFTYLRPKDGLMDSEINCIAQDKDGILWFATWWGLINYNGYDFNEFRPELGNPYSLSEKKIQFIYIDTDNNIWVASSNYLSRYDKKHNRFYKYDFDINKDSRIYIQSISEIDKHIIVHATNGIFILPKDKIQSENYTLKRIKLNYTDEGNGYIHINYSTSFENTMYLTANNLTSNRSKIFKSSRLIINEKDTLLELETLFEVKNSTVNEIAYSKNENKLYVATNNGILTYSFKVNKLEDNVYFESDRIRNIVYASNNKLYCSTGIPEVRYIDLHTGKTGEYAANPYIEGSLLNSRVNTLFEDFSGNLWIGHRGQGISILNLHDKAFTSYKQDPFSKFPLQSNQIMSFHEIEDEIIIGGRTGGLSILKKDSKDTSRPEFIPVLQLNKNGKPSAFEYGIWNIEKQDENVYWVGTDIGLFKLEKIGKEWFLKRFSNKDEFNNPIRKLFIDKNKNIWCGVFNHGLIFIPNLENNQQKEFYIYEQDENDSTSLSNNVVISFNLDTKDRFWIGTEKGLNLLEGKYSSLDLSGNSKPKMRFKNYVSNESKENQLNNNEINCIYENSDGRLWLGTQGGGINILDTETETFTYLTIDDGLPGNDIQGILSDETGKLWISTTKGLISYYQFSSPPKITYYHQSKGIQGDIFLVNSYFKALDGEMFFGGDEGFTRFYPRDVRPNTIEPKIVLTDFKFENKTIEIGDTIYGKTVLNTSINETKKLVFNHKHRLFSIGVAAIHYQYPRGNRITYKLENYDTEWRTIPAIYKNIYYSNLPTGKYLLKIKAVNSDNVISTTEKQIEIEVTPPWYKTWYGIALIVLFTLALIGGLGYILINRQRFIFEKKIDKINLENAESKMTFLTNIAHGLKTPLSLVIAPTEDLIQNYTDIKKDWKEHLLLIHRNSNYLLKLINQIIDFRKLNSGKLKLNLKDCDIIELIKEVVFNFKSFENNKQIQIKLDITYNNLFVVIDRQKIEEVLYNIISNAFKHTRENGVITISLKILESTDKEQEQIKITVFNEGETITEKEQSKIFERFYKIDENKEGAGIGLSFSRSLIELHSGNIEVESIENKGMAFHVTIPYSKSQVSPIENLSKPIEIEHAIVDYDKKETSDDVQFKGIKSNNNKPLNIVLVEDNDELRIFFKKILSRQYNCYDASNGIEGYQIIKEIIPDVVLSDIIMPEMDGYQLCRKIKENIKTCHIPIILLSAKSSHEQIVKGYQAGADTYVTKPFDLELISSQISRLVKNRELIKKKYQEQNFMVEVSTNSISKDDEFILNVRELLENNLSDANYNVKQIADDLEVSTTQLYRKLKAITGYSPVEFLRIIRLQFAFNLINERKKSVKEVCYLSGFNNISYFIKCFKEQFGITPANLRDNGKKNEENFDNTKHTKIEKI